MSDGWIKVSRQRPCPICAKPDWCTIGEKGATCMRVQSLFPVKNGGWFHPFGCEQKAVYERPKLRMPTALNAPALLAEWSAQTTDSDLEELAIELGVSLESLVALGAATAFWRMGLWSLDKFPSKAWAFPMLDAAGNTIGIRLRGSGHKWAVSGSRSGIFAPNMFQRDVVFLCEGPTSTAAALTLGFYAIGRPSCNCGGDIIRDTLKRLKIFRAVIVADNDDKPNGLQPGLAGAQKLAKEIGIKSVIWSPPTKDIRDYMHLGGTKETIESELKNFVWRKYN